MDTIYRVTRQVFHVFSALALVSLHNPECVIGTKYVLCHPALDDARVDSVLHLNIRGVAFRITEYLQSIAEYHQKD